MAILATNYGRVTTPHLFHSIDVPCPYTHYLLYAQMESSSSLLNVVDAAQTSSSSAAALRRKRVDSIDDDDVSDLDGTRSSMFDGLDQWERNMFHIPLQSFAKNIYGLQTLMTCFGATCTGEILVCSFGLLCWTISVNACVNGIWLVPVIEVLSGVIKWQFGRPRPGWNDPRVLIRSTSHEYSFPSSHAMLSWSLATFMANYWYVNVGRFDLTLVPYPVYGLYFMACMVSISRVFDGAHYVKDIIVGGIIGRSFGLYHFTYIFPMVQTLTLHMSIFQMIVDKTCSLQRRGDEAPFHQYCIR